MQQLFHATDPEKAIMGLAGTKWNQRCSILPGKPSIRYQTMQMHTRKCRLGCVVRQRLSLEAPPPGALSSNTSRNLVRFACKVMSE